MTTTTPTQKPLSLRARAHALAERSADAYSVDNYGERGWRSAALMLLRRGYTDTEAEAILRSKWTRWAGDTASNRAGWRYGRTNGADLARFLDTMPEPQRTHDVAEMTRETFPEDAEAEAEMEADVDPRAIKVSPRLRVHADCPYCAFSSELAQGTEILEGEAEGWYDNQWNQGQGGYRVLCTSCAKPFTITREATETLQQARLVLIGEADSPRRPIKRD